MASIPVHVVDACPRLLIGMENAASVDAVAADLAALERATKDLGHLGVFVHGPIAHDGRVRARMLAPAIGVPEDIANANSSGCLAAYALSIDATLPLLVEQGGRLGRPSQVLATARRRGATIMAEVGGVARARAETIDVMPTGHR